jgi:hypothetical protein
VSRCFQLFTLGVAWQQEARFESGPTPLHASFAPSDGLWFLSGKPNYAMLELLIELGADIQAKEISRADANIPAVPLASSISFHQNMIG